MAVNFMNSSGMSQTLNSSVIAGAGSSVDSGAHFNICIGSGAGALLTTGDGNVLVGSGNGGNIAAGTGNTAIGEGALSFAVTGDSNIAIGFLAGNAYVGAEASNIVIGNAGVAAESNVIRIGTDGSGAGQQDTLFIAGAYGVTPAGSSPQMAIIDENGQFGTQPLLGPSYIHITASTVALDNNKAYIMDYGAGTLIATLPPTSAFGDTIEFVGLGTNGYQIAQNGGQQITFLSSASTVGVTGSMTTTQPYSSCTLICLVPNVEYLVIKATGTYIIA